MSYSIQQSINFAQTFIQYSPLAVGTGNEPAMSLANEIQNTILNAPFTWAWNRNEYTALTLIPGTQDYVVPLTDFGFLEKVTTISPADGSVYECKDVYNVLARGVADPSTLKQGRPQACGVLLVTYGTSVKLRFMGVPDKAYGVVLTYQKLPTPLGTYNISAAANASTGHTAYTGVFSTAAFPAGSTVYINGFLTNAVNNGSFQVVSVTGTTLTVNNAAGVAETNPATVVTTGALWNIPDQYIDIYNNLFVGEAMAVVDDARANLYRARGVASLITKAEGLDEMQINAFLEQYWARTGQNQYRTASITQGSQAKGV